MNGNKPKKGKISEKKLYFVYHFLVTKSVVCNKILFKVFIHGELISGVGLSLWFMVQHLNVILMGYNPAVLLLDGVEKHRIIVNVAVALITDFKNMKKVRFQRKNCQRISRIFLTSNFILTGEESINPILKCEQPINTFAKIHLINQYGTKQYLDSYGGSDCNGGQYGVKTSKYSNRDTGSGTWEIRPASETSKEV